MSLSAERAVILFDGVCNLCNGWVDFVIRRDPAGKFAFAALQSDAGQQLLAKHNRSAQTLDGIYLIRAGQVYWKSGAVLRILAGIKGPWVLMGIFLIVPPFLRDTVYDYIAKRRYKWYGKKDTCRLPTPAERERFL